MEPKIFTPTPIDVNDRGHRLRSGSPVTNLPEAVSPMIKKLWFFFSRTFETLRCGWNCFNSLINLTLVHSFGSTSLRITGMTFLKEVGLGRAGVLVGLAVLAPGGELS